MTLGPHLLGRTAPPDTRHLEAYPFGVTADPSIVIEKEIARPTLDAYDQGATPKCVAFSTSKVVNWFNKYDFDAPWLYDRCKEVDGMPGVDGTNARAACDVLRTQGHLRRVKGKPVKAGPSLKHGISGNRWAQSVDEIRAVFATATPQPVLIGIDWYDAWFTPDVSRAGGYWLQMISQAGQIAGGHEIGVWAVSDKRQAFGLSNTWGKQGWPDLAWMPYTVMKQLFAQGADACVITDLATR